MTHNAFLPYESVSDTHFALNVQYINFEMFRNLVFIICFVRSAETHVALSSSYGHSNYDVYFRSVGTLTFILNPLLRIIITS